MVCNNYDISIDMNLEISREKIRLLQQLGIGEFGAVYDAEVRLEKNVKSRALVKVIITKASIVHLGFTVALQVFQKGTPQDLVLFWQEMQEVM